MTQVIAGSKAIRMWGLPLTNLLKRDGGQACGLSCGRVPKKGPYPFMTVSSMGLFPSRQAYSA
jgi:hypothetical protein